MIKRRVAALLAAVFISLAAGAGAQTIQTTEVSGYIFDATGAPAANKSLRITKVVKNGAVISTQTIPVRSDSTGRVVFNIIRASTAYIEGDAVGFNNIPGGMKLTIPDAATAALETLTTTAGVPAQGLAVKSNNALLANKAGTIDFSPLFTVTDSPAGELNVTLAQSYATAAELATHAAAGDPHPVYLTQTEGNALYALAGSGVTDHNALTSLTTGDPHTQYQLRTEKNAANGYAGLDAGAMLPDNRLPASIARDTETAAAVSAEAVARDAAIASASTLDRARANHTGTQTASTISDFASAVAANLPTIVNTFNTRSGAVTLISGDVTTALGYTPRDAAAATVNTFNARSGAVTLTSDDVTGALTYTPLNPANNLSELVASTARTNLGLGTMAQETAANYALLAGRAGGQTLSGGTAASENITLQSTSHVTKGYILLGTGGLVGVNKAAPGAQLHVVSSAAGTKGLIVQMAGTPTANPFEVQTSTGTAVASIDTTGKTRAAEYQVGSLTALSSADGVVLSVGGTSFTSHAGLARFGAYFNNNSQVSISTETAARIGIQVRGVASQTGNLFEGQTSAGGVVAYVSPAGVINSALEFRVAGIKIIGAQGAAVTDATDAASAITQLNALLARLRAHGLIAN